MRPVTFVVVVSLAAIVVIGPAAEVAQARAENFRATISRIPEPVRDQMVGSSWRPGCPVKLRDLRLVRLTHWNFSGDRTWGKLVVHEWFADEIARTFRKLYDVGFRIRKMHLVDRYGASDMRSMRADNTSAFNCRYRDGVCCRWSMHAYGKAIDINPVENPYVGSWGVSPPNGAGYVDRTPRRKGMIAHGDAVWKAFRRIGWEWGGDWSWPVDYQHFSVNGR
ncbi:MAG TPA: M15 family metallopeptidase [Actinomycetota bacterium]|nr:M15 family metallopeptidase [Actinomycetota bacterium]